MAAISALSFLLSLLSASVEAAPAVPFPLPIHSLRQRTGSSGHPIEGVSCESWRLAVETNNLRNWKTVPDACEDYVGHYMLGNLYRLDSRTVVGAALQYARTVTVQKDGKDIWIFDVDETSLSNLPYYAQHGFGNEKYNPTAFNEWVDVGKAPPLPETLKLFRKLQRLGIKPVFLTGREESRREVTEANLLSAGYSGWGSLILKGENFTGTAVAYKSEERKKLVEKGGYRIVGNIGDQWSDLLGNPNGRAFKLPDPMYYIA